MKTRDIELTELPDLEAPSEKPATLQRQAGYYSRRFNALERNQLSKRLARTEDEIESILNDNRKILYAYCFNYTLSLLIAQLFVVFQTTTSLEGIPEVAENIKPGANLSKEAAYAIGIPLAIASAINFLLIYSPYKIAAEATLNYATRADWKTRLKNQCNEFKEKPAATVAHYGKALVHQSVLLTANLTGGSSYVIEIDSGLKKLHPAARWSITSSILYLANEGYGCYMTPSYYEGVEFWFSKKYPWLLTEMRHGNIATPFQVMLQGASSVGLRVFPSFYYLAEAAKSSFGWWPPAPFVASLVGLHTLCVLYPTTYKHYYENKRHIEELAGSREAANALLTDEIKNGAYGYLFRQSPVTFFPVAYRSFLGGYFGYSIIAPLLLSVINEPYSMNILATLLSASLFGSMLYRAERERVAASRVLKILEPEQLQPELASEREYKVAANISAGAVTIGANVGSVFSTIGVLIRLIGNNSPAIVTATALITGERMINLSVFSGPRVADNLRNGFQTVARLFNWSHVPTPDTTANKEVIRGVKS